MTKGFPFRFESEKQKREFKFIAFTLNKSMNGLLGEIVNRFLKETKRAMQTIWRDKRLSVQLIMAE